MFLQLLKLDSVLILCSILSLLFCATALAQDNCEVGASLNNPFSNDIYVVHEHTDGLLYTAGHVHMRRLENGSWTTLAPGFGQAIYGLTSFEGDLIVTGGYSFIGGILGNNVTRYTNNDFSPMGPGFDNHANKASIFNGDLVVGGAFGFTGDFSTQLNRVARWTGTSWEAFGGGLHTIAPGYTAEVNDVIEFQGELIATGRFQYAENNTEVNSLARWDGSSWQPFGSGLYWAAVPGGQGVGFALEIYDNKLVIAGAFDTVDGHDFPWIAMWDGNSWSGMGAEPTRHSLDLSVYNGHLYSAGPFPFTFGGTEYDIAAWNGESWTPVVNVDVNWPSALATAQDDSRLYFGGSFSSANGTQTGLVAQWICSGDICGAVQSFRSKCLGSDRIGIRLRFNTPDYDGQTVSFLVNGTEIVNAVVVGQLAQAATANTYLPGTYSVELIDPADCLNPISTTCNVFGEEASPSAAVGAAITELQQNHPNPFNPSTQIRFSIAESNTVSLKIYNMLGQQIATLVEGHLAEGNHEIMWDGTDSAGQRVTAGVYIYRLVSGEVQFQRKMIMIE